LKVVSSNLQKPSTDILVTEAYKKQNVKARRTLTSDAHKDEHGIGQTSTGSAQICQGSGQQHPRPTSSSFL
jgi:hypothetical protein